MKYIQSYYDESAQDNHQWQVKSDQRQKSHSNRHRTQRRQYSVGMKYANLYGQGRARDPQGSSAHTKRTFVEHLIYF